jgi:hypothetical protein
MVSSRFFTFAFIASYLAWSSVAWQDPRSDQALIDSGYALALEG